MPRLVISMARLAPRQPWRNAKNSTGASDSTRANCGCGAARSDSTSRMAMDGASTSSTSVSRRITEARSSRVCSSMINTGATSRMAR